MTVVVNGSPIPSVTGLSPSGRSTAARRRLEAAARARGVAARRRLLLAGLVEHSTTRAELDRDVASALSNRVRGAERPWPARTCAWV